MCPKQAFAAKVAASNKDNLLLAAKFKFNFKVARKRKEEGPM
jgi:hypothetical protein